MRCRVVYCEPPRHIHRKKNPIFFLFVFFLVVWRFIYMCIDRIHLLKSVGVENLLQPIQLDMHKQTKHTAQSTESSSCRRWKKDFISVGFSLKRRFLYFDFDKCGAFSRRERNCTWFYLWLPAFLFALPYFDNIRPLIYAFDCHWERI